LKSLHQRLRHRLRLDRTVFNATLRFEKAPDFRGFFAVGWFAKMRE
jgi:hypothetical protein